MNTRSPDDADGDGRSTDGSGQDEQSSITTTVEGEVTRIGGLRYLEGASGHGVLSLLFLAGALVAARLGVWSASVTAVIVAYGVALNGLSIYAWDELRLYFASLVDTDDGPAERTLAPHRVSTEMKAELLAGLTMVGGFVVALGVGLWVLRAVSFRTMVLLSVGALAAGNLAALGWTYYTSAGR